jgi:hypothetical protein
MSNDFYNHADDAPATLSRGNSSTLRGEFDLVQTGFDKMPSGAQMWAGSANYFAAGGPADAWTIALSTNPANFLASYQDGMSLKVLFPSANTSATPTVNVNGLGPVTLAGDGGAALAAGDIPAGAVRTITYSAALGKFVVFLGNSVASAAAQAVIATQQAGIATTQAGVATTKASAASTSATNAATSESNAAGSASAASTSASQAQSYASSAASTAKFYTTIALGLAGTADGGSFGVEPGGSDGLTRPTIYQRVNSTTSLLIGAWVTGAEFDRDFAHALKTSLAVADGDGNVIGRILSGASLDVQAPMQVDSSGGINTSTSAIQHRTVLKYGMALADADGNLGFALDLNSKMVSDKSLTTGQTAQRPVGTYDYDIVYDPLDGQSLAVGQSVPAISTVQHYDNLMFAGGLRPQYDNTGQTDAQNYGSFASAVEVTSPVQPTVLGETPCAGFGDMLKQLMLKEDGLAYTDQVCQRLLSAPGYGAQTIAALSKGTTHYTRMLTQLQYGFSNATAANKSFGCAALKWEQGESDYQNNTTFAAYLAAIKQLRSDWSGDVLANVTTQTKAVHMVVMQLSTHKVGGSATPTIALAQLQAATDDPLIHIAAPMYIFSYQDSNNFHIRPGEERIMGAYLALCEKRVINDGATWKPVQPISSRRYGSVVELTFNVPVGKLKFDTTWVAQNTNYGFELFAADNVTPITINSVSLRGGNVVKIVAASAVPSGAHVHYAWTGTGNAGNGVGPRGNLRDQQGETFAGHDAILFDNRPMHNWCVHFDWTAA